MRYISDDGKVFNSEQECLDHENYERKRVEEERIKKEELASKRQSRLDDINKKYKELQKLISDYGEDYGAEHEVYFSPICELLGLLGL